MKSTIIIRTAARACGAALAAVTAAAGLQVATGTPAAAAGAMTFAGVADWDRDGNQDIIARNPSGLLLLYPGQSVRGYSAVQPVQIGNGWNGFTFAGVADWDRDGNQDVIARSADGRLWLYPGQSRRGYSSAGPVEIGIGWNPFTFADAADWDRDGHQDVVARDAANLLWLYPGQSRRGYSAAARVQIGNGW